MLTRLTHAAIAFAVTAVLYQIYVLAVTPFIEPSWSPGHISSAEAGETAESKAGAINKHRDLLAAYFPPTHWCFARPPVTGLNGQVLLVFDDGYKQSPSGKLDVPRCAIVFFPRPLNPGEPAPRDAIVLEPSGGAMLQMASSLDQAANGFGEIQFGQLQGEVIVRSDMRQPGPKDDLLIKTRDLYLNEDLIRTDQPVDMKLGEHHGFGRELEIRRMKTEDSAHEVGGLYGSIEDLAIKHDVQVTVMPGKLQFLGAEDKSAKLTSASSTPLSSTLSSDEASSPKSAEAGAGGPPIRIKSAGPFRIDLGGYKASFTEDVRAWQVHPGGKLDELRADELTLFFTKTTEWNAGKSGVTPTPDGSASEKPFAFEPASIEALGTPETPVVLKAPSQEATAVAPRMYIELVHRDIHRITLEGGDEVVLTHRGGEIHGRTLRYQWPSKVSGQRLGAMAARGGGWLRAVVDPARPDEVLEVSWKEAMQVVRRGPQPVLVLDGRPKVSMTGMGTLWADTLELFLSEQPAAASNSDAKEPVGALPASVLPQLIVARDHVAIDSSQLTAKVNHLEVKIEHPKPAAASSVQGNPQGMTAKTQADGQPAPLFDPSGGGNRAYDISGVTLKIDAVMRNRRPEVRGISVDGGVVFQESAVGAEAEQPLRIAAEHLRVTGADTPNARIEIRGAAGQNGQPLQPAHVSARGATLVAPAIAVNRGSSTAAINSPGELHLTVNRDMTGNPLPRPEPLAITWRESMTLEGRRITFLGDVLVSHATGRLRTRRLVAQTSGEVRFDGSAPQQPELEQLECWEGAVAEFDQQDLGGVTSRQHIELQSLIVNQLSGAISGNGPGKIDSVHLAKSPGAWLALPGKNGGPQPPGLVQTDPELRHLHIDFIRGVSGHLHTRTIKVHGNVEAVYGPVKSWDERLSMSPGGSPRPDEVWITCDTLAVTESPMAQVANPRLRQVELLAEGDENDVVIEGLDPKQGAFTARGSKAKFDQSKSLFILEGAPATIEQQQFPGAPRSPQSAQRMTFNQKTGAIKIDGLHQGRFNQAPVGR